MGYGGAVMPSRSAVPASLLLQVTGPVDVQLSSAADRRTAAVERRPGRLARITATVLTKNSSALLADVLAALDWCDEVLVLDTGSTDATLSIAAQFANVSLHQLQGAFPGFGKVRQLAVSLARNDWILSIDSDEVVSAELRDEILGLTLDPRAVYVMPFANYFNDRLITSCGWAPDRHERLFDRRVTNFCNSDVHERLRLDHVSCVQLRHPIRHYSYRTMDDFLRKMSAYSHLFAAQNRGRKRSSPLKAVARSVWAFGKSYLLERGILDGTEGLVISAYKAQTVFWKYLLLHEANSRRC